jgi:glyoxylase-like metal-dependent hydrolase (beta-lactamase superfamily II)
VNPERLIASATRLWGDEMDRLWGEFRPVPEHALTILRGGERFTAGARDLDVAYTPGHASHHVSYYNADSGVAFVGDTAGIRRAERGFVLPPTPPPDIDLELWHASLDAVAAWKPARLAITHFGSYEDVEHEIAAMHEALDRWGALARETDNDGYVQAVVAEMHRARDAAATEAFVQAMPPDTLWPGLDRYWAKKNR